MNDPVQAAASSAETVAPLAAEALTALKIPSDASPGYKTTEFWAHALVVVGLVLVSAAGALPPKFAAGCVTASGVAYAISRGLSKQGNSN